MAVFIDTWGWVALCDRGNERFGSVSRFVRQTFAEGARFLTTNFVVAETVTLAFSQYGTHRGEQILDNLLATLRLPQFAVEEITSERFEEALKLRRRYRDKPEISFTDLSSMVVMRELGITDVLTADQHFAKVNLGFRLVAGNPANANDSCHEC